MTIHSLPTLPAYPSTSTRTPLSPTQLSSLLTTVSNSLAAVISQPPTAQGSKNKSKALESLARSALTFLGSYAHDTALQILQGLIWGHETHSKLEKTIHVQTLVLAEQLAEEGSLGDLRVLLDLAIVYAPAFTSKVQQVFEFAAKTNPKLTLEVETDLVPSFIQLLESAQGLYNQRKAAECVLCFVLASSGTETAGSLLLPFVKSQQFINALAKLYLPLLTATARSYGGLMTFTASMSGGSRAPSTTRRTESSADDWQQIWLATKVAILDTFHLLLKWLLDDLSAATTEGAVAEKAELAFNIVFGLMDAPSGSPHDGSNERGTSQTIPPTPFLNLSLLQEYQSSHDFTRSLAKALENARERDARLDLLESALGSLDTQVSDGASKKKDPGALKILLRSSGFQPGIDNLGRGPSKKKDKPQHHAQDLPSTSTSQAMIQPPEDLETDSEISLILDILPDLSPAYVRKLLLHDKYSRNPERVLEALLEGSAPTEDELGLNREEPSNIEQEIQAQRYDYDISQRKNIFDDEVIDVGNLRVGKKNETSEEVLRDRKFIEQMKADILRRVEGMVDSSEEEDGTVPVATAGKGKSKVIVGSDDDEDTLFSPVGPIGDGEDLDGDGDSDEGNAERDDDEGDGQQIQNSETVLELAYLRDPKIFDRDSGTRRSKGRAELKLRTGWGDEQIEGWRIMLERNPKKDKILEKHEFRGNHAETNIPSSSRGLDNGAGRGRGGHRGGGRGGSGRGRGGGQSRGHPGGDGTNDSSARERAWKDKNKASRANHNRKRGHDRKMARGGAGFTPS